MNRLTQLLRAAPWKLALVAGICLSAGYFALPRGAVQEIAYNVIGLAAVAGILFGVRRNRPPDKATWWLFSIAWLCSIAGDAMSTLSVLMDFELPSPSIADLFYLATYPFLFAAVLRLGRRSTGRGVRERQVDAAIVCLGALTVFWELLMGTYAHDSTLSTPAKLTMLAYPIMDIGVLFIVVSALIFGGARDAVDKIVGVSMAVMLLGDFGYDLLEQYGTYQDGDWIDATWLISYLLIAVAALHPSMARVTAGGPRRRASRLSWLPVVAVAGFVAPTMLLTGVRTYITMLAGVTLVSAFLVAVRLNWMFVRLQYQAEQLRGRTISLQDALSARDTLAANLRHQAFHDSLTGLANRALLQDRMEHAQSAATRNSGTVAVILCDLDGFKTVNDSLGHQAGDAVLVTAAQRMRAVVRPEDTVARLGGDEFAVLIDEVHDRRSVILAADRLLAALREPWTVKGHAVTLSASAGVTFGAAGKTAEKLLSEADAAMYAAKSRGKNRHEVFEPSMQSRALERLQLVNGFAGAIERAEFYLEYQPQFSLASGRLEGFEALVRWMHPTLGLVAPKRFISLAEETGFIARLGRWALDTACSSAMTWPATALGFPSVAVNLSIRQLRDPMLVSQIRAVLAGSGLPAQRLVLEITESMLVADPEDTREILREIQRLGVTIAIDDFGTGYSSLGRLHRFPVDTVKIDKLFIDQIEGPDGEGRTFVEAILRLAREMHLSTIAEGIESESQLRALSDMGCDSGQGFLLSRPLGARTVRPFIEHATANAPAVPAG